MATVSTAAAAKNPTVAFNSSAYRGRRVPLGFKKLQMSPPGIRSPPSISCTMTREAAADSEVATVRLRPDSFGRYGKFGGKYVPETLMHALTELEEAFHSVAKNEDFQNSSAEVPQKQQRMLLIFFCVPVSPGESRVIWAFPRNFAVWVDKLIPRWIFHVRNNLILDSDLYLLHVEERKIAEAGVSNWQKACFVPTKSDTQVIAFRKWFRKYSNNQVDWGSKFNGLLPPTPPREQLMDRYWTHVVNCSSCNAAVKGLKVLEVCLQVISVASIGILAAARESLVSAAARTAIVSVSLLCFLASRWLAHFIYRNFYYHDYNHAFK